jgi:hypothetical protein
MSPAGAQPPTSSHAMSQYCECPRFIATAKVNRISMAETNHVPDKLTDFFRNPAYERRLVIFYDVLGWRNHIKAADGEIEKIGDLRRLILQSHRSLRLRHQFKMRISTFSENIVVTQSNR